MNGLLFYDLMGYNYPTDKEYFKINPDLIENIKHEPLIVRKLSSKTQDLEKIIEKYGFLYKRIPFVEHIYVANSLTFQSVHKDSDIDFFVIAKQDRIFLAKFFVWLYFKVFGMYGNHTSGKFCVGFYVTEINVDLYPISIYPVDLYLAYWIAHLQHLYSENLNKKNNVYKENMRVKKIIPNYNMKEKKILNFERFSGSTFGKRILEKIFGWNFVNNSIGFLGKKKMKAGKKKLGKDGKNIIISDNILKFQAPDIRKIVYLKYKSLKDKPFHKIKNEQNLF